MATGVVLVNRDLADSSVGPAKRHIEIQLSSDVRYESGDYLAVKGRNSQELVKRVSKRFSLSAEDIMTTQSSKQKRLNQVQMRSIDSFRCLLSAPIFVLTMILASSVVAFHISTCKQHHALLVRP